MLLSIAVDERAALHFDDIASALDAGLPLNALGGEAASGDRVVHAMLKQRGVRLTPTEDAVLQAAWQAGRVTAALRNRAAGRVQRAQFARSIWAGLRYPLLLFGMTILAGVLGAAVFGGYGLPIAVALGLLLAAGGAYAVTRGVQRGSDAWLRVPVLGRLAADLGELPYLETLQALYGAGVPLLRAHQAAVAACPVAALRARLKVADRVLQTGTPLFESLQQAAALHPESRALLATGEKAGQLEDALRRAVDRRRSVAATGVAAAGRAFGVIAYAVAALLVAYVVLTFWSNLYSLGRR